MSQLESMRDQPGTQREYETIYILVPTADSEQITQVNTRIRKIIDDDSGRLLRVENWGKRKLAYNIKKNTRGIYLYWRYLCKPFLVAEVERTLRLLDPVLRYMTVRVDANVDPGARPSDVDEETFAAAANTISEEEEERRMREESDSRDDRFDRDDDDGDDDDDDGDRRREYRAPPRAERESRAPVSAVESSSDTSAKAGSSDTSDKADGDDTSDDDKKEAE
jgi:small subunit ribosomal protein S6